MTYEYMSVEEIVNTMTYAEWETLMIDCYIDELALEQWEN